MSIVRPADPVRLVSSLPIISIESNATLADLAGELERQQVGVLGVTTCDGVDGVVTGRGPGAGGDSAAGR